MIICCLVLSLFRKWINLDKYFLKDWFLCFKCFYFWYFCLGIIKILVGLKVRVIKIRFIMYLILGVSEVWENDGGCREVFYFIFLGWV